MVSDCGQHHALMSMSFNPSPQGDGGPGAASPQGAVILMRGAPTVRSEVLAACGVPQSGRGGGPSSTDRLTVSMAQGLYFRKDLARGRSGVFVGCYVGMRAGIGRCYHRMQCEGIWCQLFHYPPRAASQLHAHALARFSSLLYRRQGWDQHGRWMLRDTLLRAVGRGNSVGCLLGAGLLAGCLLVPAFPGWFLGFLSALRCYGQSWV